MTAHAAKGLEAPVVFLVDNGAQAVQRAAFAAPAAVRSRPASSGKARAICGARPPTSPTAIRAAAAARIKEAAEEEYRRLLYVGMTRAEDRLIVCGYYGKQQPTAGTWHALVSAALAGAPETEALPDPLLGERAIATGSSSSRRRPERAGHRDASAVAAERAAGLAPPAGAARTGAAAAVDAVAASASIEGGIEPATSRNRRCSTPARNRHWRLPGALRCTGCCRSCPAWPEGERDAAARRYIERVGGAWLPDERDGRRALGHARSLATPPSRRSSRAEFACRSGHCRNAGDRRHRAVDLGQDRPPGGDGERCADRRLQDQPPGAVAARARCRRPMSRSSRSIGHCCSRSIPGGP